ncbi:MAG: hypothetical protein MRZ79_00235 [Bacteroidia bacterium]|nr:hypothetical protein [Bacteroidia bacterium]
MMSHNDDLFEELEGAPLLRSLKRKEVFKVPEGYFDQLSSDIQDKLDDEEVLMEAPLLQKIGKRNIWEVPANYFAELPGRVMAKLPVAGKVRPLFGRQRTRLFSAIAAGIAILLLVWLGLRPSTPVEKELASLDNISQEELHEVLSDAGVDEYDLMAVLSEDEQLLDQMENDINDDLIQKLEEDEFIDELELGDLEDLIFDM